MKPIKVFGDYVVCFEAEPEYLDMRHHFVKECGWTQEQFAKIQDFAWFSAKVSIWKDGKELAADYLGACCYETEDEFWTTYEGDYFVEMVRHCAEELGDRQLLAQVLTWRATFKGVVA